MNYLETARDVLTALVVSREKESVERGEVSHEELAEGNACDIDETDWWSMLTPEEREALKPRPIRRRCPWCKRINHSTICNELRPKRLMPFGKYKGQPVEELPRDYVQWIAESGIRPDQETRDEVYDRFGIAIH